VEHADGHLAILDWGEVMARGLPSDHGAVALSEVALGQNEAPQHL